MKHSQSGFTIIEMLIAVAISSIVIGGALSLQLVFHRATNEEESIADMQSNLDGIRFFLQRSMRQVGAGLGSSVSYWNCAGSFSTTSTLGMRNNNAYPPVDDFVEGGVDNDPDWLEYVLPGDLSVTYINGRFNRQWATVEDATGFKHKDIIGITINGVSCLYRLTNVATPKTGPRLHFAPAGGGPFCMNQISSHPACGIAGDHDPTSPISVLSLGETPFHAIRVDTSNPNMPMLMHGVRMFASSTTDYTWMPLAAGVEDLQLAVHIDTSNPPDERGDIWVWSRDTLPAEVGRMRALRVSVVMRTPTQTSSVNTRRPGFEDRPAGAFDRYKRRSMQFIVKIPNRPQTGGTI